VNRRLTELSSAAAVLAALDKFQSLGRDAFLSHYGFGASRDYFVIDPRTGIEADSKAVAGVALGLQFPESGPLHPADFSGGDATVGALLQALGFTVRHRSAQGRGEDWTEVEVQLIVADYLSMLTLELNGQRYSKTEHRRRLMTSLSGRSEASIEFKHGNISAVMIELGFPYLRGYKPRVNFQRRVLTDAVSAQVLRHRVLDEAALSAVERPVEVPSTVEFAKVRTQAPRRENVIREAPAAYERGAVRRDYLQREAQNRRLGEAGEEFALAFERWRLVELGAGQLAEKIEHVSRTQGDGLGYDIQSFEADGSERFIEVKTTTFGERTPFFVSANEVRFAKARENRFRLYRMFDFRSAPRMFELAGPIEHHCLLDPTTYRASFG